MKSQMEYFVILLLFELLHDSSEEGYCSFPGFLWAAMPDGSDRKWLSKTEYVKNTNTWERQREITVRKTEMIIKYKYHAACNSLTIAPCYRKDVIYQVICLAEEPGDKFRVVQKDEDSMKPVFSCMKFVKINENIVQVFVAKESSLNEDRLCYEESLLRNEWPWIVSKQEKWSRCPFQGGYDFEQYYYRDTKVCGSVWRPSRLEMECIFGEGVEIIFPDPLCNTLTSDNNSLSIHLQCWGSWEDDEFKFTVLGLDGSLPQYVMRLPQAVSMFSEFTAYLYFSPVCPINVLGQPPDGIHYVKLRMKHSEPGTCFDESEKCREFAQEGKCTNSALHEYANFCRRSCGLCDYVPSARPECRFPEENLGEWMQFDQNNKVSVTIATGEITFSHLGHFICKTKHWSKNRYKLMSVFTNGCRPRYTCIDFVEDNQMVLHYKISSSQHTDQSFQMCNFKDDPLPLGGQIRSKNMKMLLATSHIHWGSCGLSGEINVNVSLPQGSACKGILTDWNPRSCNSRSKLILALQGQSPSCLTYARQDHVCIAHMNLDDGNSLLITQHQGHNNEFRCWAIETYPRQMYYRPWKRVLLMAGPQCGPGLIATSNTQLILSPLTSVAAQPCQEYDEQIKDIYKINSPETSSDLVKVRTKVVGLHKGQDFIKPRERKSNSAPSTSTPFLLLIPLLTHR